jgi:hypothetical protein
VAADPSLPVLGYQMRETIEALKSLQGWRGTTDVKLQTLDGKIEQLSTDVSELSDVVSSLRRTVMAFAFTVAGSSVVFAFSILAATGRI